MSDLPPSTVPDDEHQGTSRVDPEEQHVEDEDQTEEEELKHEDQKETDDGITENKEQDEGSVEQNEDLEGPDNTGQDVESQGDDEESGDEDDEDDSQIDEPAKNQDEIETETEKVIQEEENDGNGDNDNNGSKTEEEDDDDEEEDDDDDEEDEEDTDGEVDKTDEGKSASVDGENEKKDVKNDNNTSHVEQTNTDEQKTADSEDEAEDSEDEGEDREDEPEDREDESEDREEEAEDREEGAENRDDEPEDKADKQEDETDDNEDQQAEDERVVNNEQEQVHANITSDDNQQSDKEEEHQEQVEQDTHTHQEDEQETAEKTDDDQAEENRDKKPSDDVTDTNLVIVPPPVKVGSDKDEPAEQPGESIEKDKNKEKENDELEEDDTKERKTHQRTQSSDDDTTREYNKIGGKKVKDNQTKISLTTVLVSRDEDEKKRMKNRSKSKSQKMRKLARKKTKKFGTKGENGDEIVMDDEENMYSSKDETKPIGERSAPFIEQYNNKKKIEHILEQQHYWSDEEGDKESFGVHVNLSSVFGSTQSESESDYEELTGPDGVVHRVKRSHGRDETEQLNDDYTGTKRTKSFDSLASVEDPESPKGHVSKKRINEHDIQNDRAFDRTEDEEPGKSKDDETTETDDKQSKARIIYVKEKYIDKKQARNKVKMNVSQRTSDGSDVASDICDTDMDRLSERDSGLDEELEEAVDVVLNKDQQAMIVDMLFDKEMNLRPQFARDEDGRIIRRLDNTVIYDPHSGRFTFHKKFGKIFNVPRLRRNRKGRPTGGYVDDPFGPHESEIQTRTPSSKLLRRSASGKSTRSRVTSITESPSPEMKRPRGDGKLVGFMMPDDDIESLTADQLDIHKRGRRDIGSALRRKLNKRLFRKKRNVAPISTFLPDITMKRALTHDGMTNGQETTVGPRGVSSLNVPLSRSGPAFGTPGTHRRPLGTANADQQQMYRQGLERDKRILEERQDGLNKKPFEAFGPNDGQENIGDNSDEDETEDGEYGEQKPAFYTSQSFYTDGGRLVVRERGCPELHRPATLFTIVRRQEDLERERTAEIVDDNSNINRNCKSAPSLTKSLDDHDFHREAEMEMTCHGTRHNGSGSQLSGIDNNRLRRLLEELYKDKKYFDQYIEAQEPDSEEFIHSKGLAEHGRGYLLERAEYWDRRGPLPPKPHMTDIGWKMHRQQTMMESRINTDRSSTMSNMTATEEQHTGTIPGVVDSMEGGEANTNDNDNKDISKD